MIQYLSNRWCQFIKTSLENIANENLCCANSQPPWTPVRVSRLKSELLRRKLLFVRYGSKTVEQSGGSNKSSKANIAPLVSAVALYVLYGSKSHRRPLLCKDLEQCQILLIHYSTTAFDNALLSQFRSARTTIRRRLMGLNYCVWRTCSRSLRSNRLRYNFGYN